MVDDALIAKGYGIFEVVLPFLFIKIVSENQYLNLGRECSKK